MAESDDDWGVAQLPQKAETWSDDDDDSGNASASQKTSVEHAEPTNSTSASSRTQTMYRDSMGDLQLNLQSHADALTRMVVPKVRDSTAKKPQKKFLEDTLSALQGNLSVAELEQLHKCIKDFVKKKKNKIHEEEKKKRILDAEAERQQSVNALGAQEVNDEDYFANFE